MYIKNIHIENFALFIDEAQNLDADALALFEKLSENIYAYIVGDPKQSIEKCFINLTLKNGEKRQFSHL